MASKNFSRTLVRTQGQRMGRVLSGQFSRKRRTQTGTYLGSNQVRVGGQVYRFRNTVDLDVVPGNQVSVVNAGRRAHAVYEPATGGGTVSVSDGGGDGTVGAHGLNSHSDVGLSGLASDDVLVYDGNNWVNSTDVAVLSRANTFTAAQTFPNSGVHILDTGGDHDLILASGEDLSADHTLTMVLSDADRTVTLNGNPTLNDWFDQSVKQAASPTFAAITLGNTGLQVEDTDASHTLTLKPGSNLAANRTFTLTTGDADRTLTLSGDLTVPQTGTAALLGVANVFTANQRFDADVLISNSRSAYNSTAQASLYMTDGGGGSYPFNEASNFVIQGRSTTRDVVIATGSTPAVAAVFFDNQHVAINTTTDSAQLSVLADGASTVGAYVNTAASPSADIQQWAINGSVTARIDNAGQMGLGASPQGLLHGYDSISGFLHWEFDGLAGTAQTVIPNGAGDVVYGLGYQTVIRSSGGTVQTRESNTAGVEPGNSGALYQDGSDQVDIKVAADGSVTVERTGGTLTYKVALWLFWM